MSDRIRLARPAAILCFALAACAGAQTPPPSTAPPPLTLATALERARAHSPEAAIARSEAEESRANARVAGAPFRPEAYVTTTPGWTTGLPVTVAGQVPSVFGVAVRATLYDVSSRAGEASAAAESESRQAALARAETAVERAVTASYARVVSDQRRTEAARRSLAGHEAIFRRLSALAREGRATELDVSRAELDVLRAKQRLLDRTLGADLDAMELRRLVDWPAEAPLELSDDPLAQVAAPPSSGNLEAARSADPEIRALDRQVEELGLAARLQSRAFQPSVIAETQYLRLAKYNNFDQYFNNFKADDFSIAVAVSIPVWTGGRHGDLGMAAKARLERAQAARRARDRDLELAVRRAEAELMRTSAAAAVSKSAESVAAESLRVARALASEGRGTPSDVDNAEIAAAEATEDSANAADAELAARLALRELRADASSPR